MDKVDHIHTPFIEYAALVPYAIVALDNPSWTRLVYSNLVKMGTQWMPNGTTITTCPSSVLDEQKQRQAITSSDPYDKATKLTLPTIVISGDPSKENSTT